MKKYNLIMTLFFIFASIIFISCTDKDKELINPNFDTDLQFTLSSRSYSVGEMVQRQSQIKIDSTSTRYLLKFKTDEIKKDTSLQSFIADVFVELQQDTNVVVKQNDTINVEMIVQRDSVRIDEADISSGIIAYTITNFSSFPGVFYLQFIGMTKESNGQLDTLTVGGLLKPNDILNKSVDLDGYKYVLPLNQPFRTTRPGFWVKGKIIITGVTSEDSVNIRASVSQIEFSRIKGRVKPIPLGTKTQTFVNSLSKEMSEFIKGVSFDSIRVTVKGGTTIKGFPIKMKGFRVTGKFNDQRPNISLLFKDKFGNFVDYFDTLFLPNSISSFIFDKSNTNISSFISQAPDSIIITSENILNPTYLSGEVNANDSIKISFFAEAWSQWRVQNSTFEDTLTIEMGDDVRKKMDGGKSGQISLNLENLIPVEGSIIAYFADSLKKPLMLNGQYFYATKNTANDSVLTFLGAFINAQGEVVAGNHQLIQKDIGQDEINLLKKAYYVIVKFNISTTNQQVVYLSANDKVLLNFGGRIKLELKSDDLK